MTKEEFKSELIKKIEKGLISAEDAFEEYEEFVLNSIEP